ncbi:MAG TPA: hypothetical protein DEF72_07670 [Gammaproteobacteria bacterium]|nr:hypothetical protein [Gammaproteobacteria bacterium]|tara:strand:+ start:1433 stop:1726 length:294 start_codon:yes stop_codon:yes gene_type:complete
MWWAIFFIVCIGVAIYVFLLMSNPYAGDDTMNEKDRQMAEEFARQQALKNKKRMTRINRLDKYTKAVLFSCLALVGCFKTTSTVLDETYAKMERSES